MRILALIPARGGSKRVPNKNIRLLGGKPLINWTIGAAQGIQDIADILVSTDSPAIAEAAKAAGVLVPWLRPDELATDAASSIDVCIHGLDWYEEQYGKVDGLMLLQPTSPFRKSETIRVAIREYMSQKHESLVTVSPASPHPAWCFHEENGELVPLCGWEDLQLRSQDLKPAYSLNGMIYISNPELLRARKSFLMKGAMPLLINDPIQSLDIDTEFDWSLAELFLEYFKGLDNA